MAESNGPDRINRGPNCCCDPCVHDHIGCEGECCRCVPALLCVSFTPTTPTDECISVYALFGTEDNDAGVYSGALRNIEGKGYSTPIVVTLVKRLSDGVCLWNVLIDSYSVDEDFVLDGVDVTCHAPILEVSIGGVCPGTIRIEPYLRQKVPFQSVELGIEEVAFTCGACDAICDTLCVDFTSGDQHWRREFVWNGTHSRWERGNDYLTPSTVGGACQISVYLEDAIDAFSPVTISACGIGDGVTAGLRFDTTGSGGQVLKVSCNLCSCWDWICGRCRCACDAICLMLQSGFGMPSFAELAWDPVGKRWGDDTYAITLTRDAETGGCLLNVPGWDPEPIESCGTEINFSLEDDDGNRAIGRCKNCHCFTKPAECCGTNVYELPLVLVAEVEGVSECGCFTATVYLIYDPTGSLWIGTGLGGCGDTRITISVQCNGECPGDATVEVCCNPLWPTPAALDCNFASGFTVGTAECPPLLLVLEDIVVDRSCCENEPMAGGTIKVTITE